MRLLSILALFLLSTGCIGNNSLITSSDATNNVYRMREICLGMSEEEVFQIMHYPAINEQIVYEELCYDVWFYVTRMTILGQTKPVARNLTPLIFKEGILVAKGYDYYNHLLDQKEGHKRYPSRRSRSNQDRENEQIEKARIRFEKKQKQERENEALEKALDAPPGSKKKQVAPQTQTKPTTTKPLQPMRTPKAPAKKEKPVQKVKKPKTEEPQAGVPQGGAGPLQPRPATPVQPSAPAQPQATQPDTIPEEVSMLIVQTPTKKFTKQKGASQQTGDETGGYSGDENPQPEQPPAPQQQPAPNQPQPGQPESTEAPYNPEVSRAGIYTASKKLTPKPKPEPEPPKKEEEDPPEKKEKKGYKWTEEDERMQDQQQDQNFDYW